MRKRKQHDRPLDIQIFDILWIWNRKGFNISRGDLLDAAADPVDNLQDSLKEALSDNGFDDTAV